MKRSAVGIIILILIILGSIYVYTKYASHTSSEDELTECTKEARICPDGSSVGRTGPNCEFEPCPWAEIPAYIFNTSCVEDNDCMLINSSYDYKECWAGACDDIDYSKDEYIAANAVSHNEFLDKYSAQIGEKCGPAPGCPSKIVNDSFSAACVGGICKKIPK